MLVYGMAKYPHLKSLNTFYKPHRAKIVLFVVFTLLAGVTTLAFPFATSQIIINLTGEKYKVMAVFALILFGLIALDAAFEFIANFVNSKTTNALFLAIRREVAHKTMSMNLSAVYAKGSGFFLERLGEDCREVSGVLLNIARAVINIVVNLGFIGYIAVLNPWLGLIFGTGLVILVFLEYFRVSRMLANMKKSKRAIEKVKANETEILKGIKEIKGIGARGAIIEKHSSVSRAFVDVRYRREMFNTKMQSGIDLVKAVTDLAILLFAGLVLLPKGAVALAAVLVVYNYKGNIYGLIAGLARIKDTYVNGELAAKRINDVINAPADETDNFGGKSLASEIKTIAFRDVAFSYNEERAILKDIDFEIDKPGVYGFVGKSGSGKSTIFSLLTRFYKQTAGSITINGTDIAELDEGTMRNTITPVLQDPYMFNDTIMNNVRFARNTATNDEVIQACTLARIHDEIVAMRDGYDTVIGENGATISGGQKQRLEIARALLKDTKVMLFDEATSALDKTNLNYINDLLVELGKVKIILVIAHRLGVMRRCDKVIVLDEGKIIAVGHHDELCRTCDYYAELFKKSSTTEEKKEEI